MSNRMTIAQFILDDLLAGSRDSLDPDEHLLESGALDSLATLRLITFLEERFDLTVTDGDVVADNFGTLRQLEAFVDRKRGL